MLNAKSVAGFLPRSMMLVTVVAMLLTISCGKTVRNERTAGIRDGSSNAVASLNLGQRGLPAICREIADEPVTAGGISDLIAMFQKDGHEGLRTRLIACKPRELLRTRRMEIAGGSFDEVCGHAVPEGRRDLVVSCLGAVENGKQRIVRFDLAPSRAEQVLASLPVLAAVIGSQVVAKLPRTRNGKPNTAYLQASLALGFATNHLKPVLLGQGFETAATFLVDGVKNLRQAAGKPELTDAEIYSLQTLSAKAFQDLSGLVARSDSLTQRDVAAVSSAVFGQFPELTPWQFVLPFLFSDGGEALFPQSNFSGVLTPEVIGVLAGFLGQQSSGGSQAGSTGQAH